jgi:O-succinylbenzoic acid--CoA ligase
MPRASVFSLEAAAREGGERAALVFARAGEGSVSYRELARAGAEARDELIELRSRQGFLALVATPEPVTLARFFTALELGLPVLLQHPRATAEGRAALEDELARTPPPSGALVMLETSGSTGRPKLVLHSEGSLSAAAAASAANLGWSPAGDRWLLSLPFAHVGGLGVLLRCFLGRQTTVVGPLDTAAPLEAARHLEELDVTLLSLVPTQLTRLLLEPNFRLPPKIRQVLLGGARLTEELRSRASARSIPLLSTYGMTEFCSQICTERPGDLGTGVGPALPGTEVRLMADGTIQARGPTACLGYLGLPSPFDEDGWFTTSDRGQWDERGHLHVLGRKDHVIISGGENVHPETVEAALLALPEIAECAVVGVPDADWGERIVAGVVLYPSARKLGARKLEKRWREELRLRLPSFAVPKAFVELEALPLLGIGKIDRDALRRQLSGG